MEKNLLLENEEDNLKTESPPTPFSLSTPDLGSVPLFSSTSTSTFSNTPIHRTSESSTSNNSQCNQNSNNYNEIENKNGMEEEPKNVNEEIIKQETGSYPLLPPPPLKDFEERKEEQKTLKLVDYPTMSPWERIWKRELKYLQQRMKFEHEAMYYFSMYSFPLIPLCLSTPMAAFHFLSSITMNFSNPPKFVSWVLLSISSALFCLPFSYFSKFGVSDKHERYKYQSVNLAMFTCLAFFFVVLGGHSLESKYLLCMFTLDPLPFVMFFSSTIYKDRLSVRYREGHFVALFIILLGNIVFLSGNDDLTTLSDLSLMSLGAIFSALYYVGMESQIKNQKYGDLYFQYFWYCVWLVLFSIFTVFFVSIPQFGVSDWSHFFDSDEYVGHINEMIIYIICGVGWKMLEIFILKYFSATLVLFMNNISLQLGYLLAMWLVDGQNYGIGMYFGLVISIIGILIYFSSPEHQPLFTSAIEKLRQEEEIKLQQQDYTNGNDSTTVGSNGGNRGGIGSGLYGGSGNSGNGGSGSKIHSGEMNSGYDLDHALKMFLNDPDIRVLPSSEVKFSKIIGRGAFGEVFRGTWNDRDVALKRVILALRTFDDSFIQDFIRETKLMNALDHPNIVEVVGICVTSKRKRQRNSKKIGIKRKKVMKEENFENEEISIEREREREDEEDDLYLVTELMQFGSLSDIIYNESFTLSLHWKLKFAIDAANGMNYLHLSGVIHRDLKCANFLVNKEWVCKIADFGISSIRPKVEKTMTVVGTPMYMAPEVISKSRYSFGADVYSFGVTLCELFNNAPPYSEEEFASVHPMQIMLKVVSEGLRPHVPTFNVGLSQIIKECLESDPEARPSFDEIIVRLNRVLTQNLNYNLKS